ncbi:hypothetical protein CLV35_1025 [Motilibacter peucedani]|uniref:Uncharacterized protein n=1 Tax=Motilibacter peucedani TaxID=598650 RepID=A0A420XR93_9ACTN|nr:hypothetical protein [Motilibacter peucedani]RKS77339.1 hypothetical protein CLV35_1025 [Motilibacter peucedani]
MTFFVLVLLVAVLAAAFVLAVVAYPHRGRRVPGPQPVSAALDRVGGRVSELLEEASATR